MSEKLTHAQVGKFGIFSYVIGIFPFVEGCLALRFEVDYLIIVFAYCLGVEEMIQIIWVK